MSDPRTNLLDLEPDVLHATLQRHFTARGVKDFRARQVARWIFEGDATSFDEMTDLPLEERDALKATFDLQEPEAATISVSEDGTAKHLWRLHDGELIESVLIPTEDRLTLCISSQAGCAMGCTFCATGWGGFRRHLTAGEIVSQFRGARRWAETNGYGPVTNVVYMGMGEPLANRDAVFASLTLLNHGYDFGARRITVSTVGVVPGIEQLAARPEQFGLALSLHSPEESLRRELIPLEKRWPIPVLMEALRKFDAAGGRRITFEYTMIDGLNDSLSLVPALADMARELHAFVNLIPFNPIPDRDWVASPMPRIRQFARALEDRGVDVFVREPRGRDIAAACGQLRTDKLVQLEGTSSGG
ncbi:MAG TPA: 23S rRNA (adenine(2503)-C(2))-methyltransferase RlmN [Longimicrobiales bacterium]|nr:23S rRNA (adenine(2503)-C(2))-methyltransferase RlmN [Longimicrobiales bacterium]